MGKNRQVDIWQALRQIPFTKRRYFVFKFPEFKMRNEDQYESLEAFIKSCGQRTDAGFRAWEKTDEYKNLVALALDARATNDLIDMYQSVRKNALTGDEKAVKLMLQLQSEISARRKQAEKFFSNKQGDEKEEDDLI